FSRFDGRECPSRSDLIDSSARAKACRSSGVSSPFGARYLSVPPAAQIITPFLLSSSTRPPRLSTAPGAPFAWYIPDTSIEQLASYGRPDCYGASGAPSTDSALGACSGISPSS